MELIFNLLIIQALMGAFDTIYHHELTVALPRCPTAGLELKIHSIRALLYGLVFFGLAWFEWRGFWVWAPVIIILIEVGLTLWDFVVEDETRMLPASERITHTLLAINGGAVFVLLALELPLWLAQESQLYFIDYGWRSWFLTVTAVGVALSGIRDGLAAWSIQRLQSRLNLDLGQHQRVLITGATGFIGSALCNELIHGGHELTVITRRPIAASVQFAGKVRAVKHATELSIEEYFDVVINLAGAPVVGIPWSKKRKRVLLESRTKTTEDLLEYVRFAKQVPTVWVQASAIGYYGTQSEKAVDETFPQGEGFAAELCQQWEAMTDELKALNIRCATLRFGMVFGRSGGGITDDVTAISLWVGFNHGDRQTASRMDSPGRSVKNYGSCHKGFRILR